MSTATAACRLCRSSSLDWATTEPAEPAVCWARHGWFRQWIVQFNERYGPIDYGIMARHLKAASRTSQL